MTCLAVAALSARAMAEAAARDGFDVIALDLFGDADTRRAASRWMGIGAAAELRVDPDRTLAALRELARSSRAEGWVAGSGFEAQPELLAAGAALLPLLGTAPEAVAAVRAPRRFFGVLDELRIAHPPVQWRLPDDGAGWLVKDALACGGGHVRRLAGHRGGALPPQHYVQREQHGTPMSATFVADGRRSQVWGCNQQLVRGTGARPYRFGGVIGPVPLPPAVAAEVARAVAGVTQAFALRGVCGLDFLLDGDQIAVLEVNPRPPASIALYDHLATMQAHWRACREGVLPAAPGHRGSTVVNGTEIVFARRALVLGNAALKLLATWPDAHDVPGAAGVVPAGHPVCSLGASAQDATELRALLAARRDALTTSLEKAA